MERMDPDRKTGILPALRALDLPPVPGRLPDPVRFSGIFPHRRPDPHPVSRLLPAFAVFPVRQL